MRAFLALVFFLPLAVAQTTIHVPADQPTIQAGINAAHNGDTVLVAPGTYYENIDFKGKAITVTSSAGPAVTTIDGGSKGPAVSFGSGEPRTAVLSHLTVQHGGNFASYSTQFVNETGGIVISASSPTLINNVITLNNCWDIEVNGAAPLIQGNEISATQDPKGQCSFGGGAGIYISGNLNYSSATNDGTAAIVLGNTIENNVESGIEDAGGNGGAAIAVWGGSPVIQNNILRNNSSPGGSGGAINIEFGVGASIVQNLIYGNSAGCGGGAIAFEGNPDPRTGIAIFIANNTIVNNTDIGNGGYTECTPISQIYPSPDTYGTASPANIIINNIVSGSTSYPAVNCSWFDGPKESVQPTFQNNILNNAGGPFFGSYCIDVSGRYNNITADPQFVSPSTGDYHLRSTSPAIDSGQNTVQQTFLNLTGIALSQDLDGNPRVQNATGQGCIIDMGAYEYPGTVSICGTAETLTSSLNPSPLGQSVTFTAQLISASGTPTGTIQFLDGSSILSTQPVSGTGSATFTTSSLAVGSHSITANYQPTGSFGAGSASLTQVINGYTTTATLTCLPNPIAVFNTALLSASITSANGTPTGSIAFTDNGAALATQTLINGATTFTYTGSVAETHTLTATYTPTGSFAASSATCSEVVSPLPTTSALTVTPSTSTYGSPVTLSASVSLSTLPGHGTPTGVVTFYDGSSSIGAVTLDTSGHAAFTTSTLAVGTHSLTATYSGNTIYSASNSSVSLENINPLPPDFAITLASPTIAIQTQHHLTTTLTLTSLNNFGDFLAITCANLPAYVTCKPTPTPSPLAAGATNTISLYLDTDSVLGYAHLNPAPPRNTPISPISLALVLSPFGLFAAVASRRAAKSRLRLLTLLLAATVLSTAIGCGDIIYPVDVPPFAATGTYTIPITATGATTGIVHSANLTLRITP